MATEVAIEAGLVLAGKIVDIIVKAAPAIQAGVISAEPYVAALAGMLTGTNATQAQIDALQAQLEADSADFQKPLSPEAP